MTGEVREEHSGTEVNNIIQFLRM